MKCFEPQWDLSHSGSWLPHLQTNGVEKFNLPVTESSSLGKNQICIAVKINEEYFSWVRSNILRMLAKIVSEKRCAELLYITARSKYSICRSCFSCNFYFCHLCDVLVSLIQCAHLIIAFSDVTTVLCISLPKAGGVSSELLFMSWVPNWRCCAWGKGKTSSPSGCWRIFKIHFHSAWSSMGWTNFFCQKSFTSKLLIKWNVCGRERSFCFLPKPRVCWLIFLFLLNLELKYKTFKMKTCD